MDVASWTKTARSPNASASCTAPILPRISKPKDIPITSAIALPWKRRDAHPCLEVLIVQSIAPQLLAIRRASIRLAQPHVLLVGAVIRETGRVLVNHVGVRGPRESGCLHVQVFVEQTEVIREHRVGAEPTGIIPPIVGRHLVPTHAWTRAHAHLNWCDTFELLSAPIPALVVRLAIGVEAGVAV